MNDGGLRSLQDFSKNFRDDPGRGAFGLREVVRGWNVCGFGWEVLRAFRGVESLTIGKTAYGGRLPGGGGLMASEKSLRGAEWFPARLKNSCKACGGVSLSE